jgi:large subunit ribosomal protein L16
VLYEIEGVPEELARRAFLRAHHKLPIQTKFLMREGEL